MRPSIESRARSCPRPRRTLLNLFGTRSSAVTISLRGHREPFPRDLDAEVVAHLPVCLCGGLQPTLYSQAWPISEGAKPTASGRPERWLSIYSAAVPPHRRASSKFIAAAIPQFEQYDAMIAAWAPAKPSRTGARRNVEILRLGHRHHDHRRTNVSQCVRRNLRRPCLLVMPRLDLGETCAGRRSTSPSQAEATSRSGCRPSETGLATQATKRRSAGHDARGKGGIVPGIPRVAEKTVSRQSLRDSRRSSQSAPEIVDEACLIRDASSDPWPQRAAVFLPRGTIPRHVPFPRACCGTPNKGLLSCRSAAHCHPGRHSKLQLFDGTGV